MLRLGFTEDPGRELEVICAVKHTYVGGVKRMSENIDTTYKYSMSEIQSYREDEGHCTGVYTHYPTSPEQALSDFPPIPRLFPGNQE